MRKILNFWIIAGLVFISCGPLKAKVEQPNVPVPFARFVPLRFIDSACGKLLFKEHNTENGERWIGFFREGSEKPFALSREVLHANDEVFWVDKNSDGEFDEKYQSTDEITTKYPDYCDVFKK